MSTTPFKTVNPNKHAGSCRDCGTRVAPGAGRAELPRTGGKWEVVHTSCATLTEPTPATVPTAADNSTTFPLTSEQEEVVRAFMGGETIAVQAGAGTGKTSTLVAIAKSTSQNGSFVAFNKGIVMDAKAKMPRNVKARTMHSLAFQQVGKRYGHRLDNQVRQTSGQMARHMGLDPFMCQLADGTSKVLNPDRLAGMVIKALKNFARSADHTPGPRHVSYVDGIDLPTTDGERTYTNNDHLAAHLADAIDLAWEDMRSTTGSLPFDAAYYLKMWELGEGGPPSIPGEFVLFDEAQDANPVMLSVVRQQSKQVVFVGDEQQAINEWMGAVDAMATVPAERTSYLTNSFRFGPEIATVANRVLSSIEGAKLRLTGLGAAGKVEATTSPDCILTRTNAGSIRAAIEELDAGRSVHLVNSGGNLVRFAEAALDLQQGRRTDHPELSIFSSWGEVVAYAVNDILGDELAPMVKLIEDHGAETVIKAAGSGVSEEDADVVICTTHKSKGREWDTVQLFGDFFPMDRMDVGEFRLMYVAVTRARKLLDVESCPPAIEVVYPERSKS